MVGKCPRCGSDVRRLQVHELDANVIGTGDWKSVTYNCPTCQTILGCQVNPVLLREDIVDMTVAAVMKKLGRA